MDPGSIHLQLRQRRGLIAAVQVALHRPALTALLVGQPASQAVELIPLIYAVCARAQAAAAGAALAAARGEAVHSTIDRAVRAEAAGELALALTRGEASAWVARARRGAQDPATLAQLLQQELLGVDPRAWLAIESEASLLHWAEAGAGPLARECRRRLALAEPQPCATAALPAPAALDTLATWPVLSPAYARAPTLAGHAAETGPAARLATHPLVVALQRRPLLQHWIARLIEFVRHASEEAGLLLGRLSAAGNGAGRGRAAVETARGTLVHEITLQDERIDGYVVVAPTEWNFHPHGALPAWLGGMPAASAAQARALAARAVEALDPCVECRYDIIDDSAGR